MEAQLRSALNLALNISFSSLLNQLFQPSPTNLPAILRTFFSTTVPPPLLRLDPRHIPRTWPGPHGNHLKSYIMIRTALGSRVIIEPVKQKQQACQDPTVLSGVSGAYGVRLWGSLCEGETAALRFRARYRGLVA